MNNIFSAGKVTSVLDASYGSVAKGVISSWLAKNHKPDILITANGRNSSHTVDDFGRRTVFKVLPCGTFYNGYQGYRPLVYIGPGAAFTVGDLVAEMAITGITREQLYIHPMASVVTPQDIAYENGLSNFEGDPFEDVQHDSGTTRHGTTGSGSGAARAKKSLRKGLIARDCPDLRDFIANAPQINRMITNGGLRGLLEGSQGYLLSLYGPFYPNCTSRAVTLAGFFADCDLSPHLIGEVCAVARTYPIRIAKKRYFADGKFMTWEEVQEARQAGREVGEVEADSGGWYADQREMTWKEVSILAGIDIAPELTTLTKLPRRIATWSQSAMRDFLAQNRPPAPHMIRLFLTFTNYLGAESATSFINRVGIQRHVSEGEISHLYTSDRPGTDSIELVSAAYGCE